MSQSLWTPTGGTLGLVVVGQRGLWLNLSTMEEKDESQFLDQPVDPKGLFGPAVATMQQRFEGKKKEAFRSFEPHRSPIPMQLQATRHSVFTQARAAIEQAFWQSPRRENTSSWGEFHMNRINNLPLGNESP